MNILLVTNKIADFKIAVADNAKKVEQTVSEELQQYIEKATGARAEIVKESKADGRTIYVGHTEYAKNKAIIASSKENWIIKAVDGNIVLTGGINRTDRGVAYAVYHFLEDYLGVHWWSFAEEFIPEMTDFSVPDNIDDNKTSDIMFRKIIDIFTHSDFVAQARNRMNIIGDDGVPDGAFSEDVKARGGVPYMGPPHQCHTMPMYFPADEYFDEHPDWWAYNEVYDTRIKFGQMCLCNEEFYQAMLKKLLDNIETENRKCKETGTEKPYFYSITFADAQYLCECPKCKEIIQKAGRSGYSLQFVNRLARDVAKYHSDVMLETLAYSKYIEPPLDDTIPEGNVIIRYADIRQDMLHDLNYKTNEGSLRRIKAWSELCKKNGSPFYIWDYLLHLFPCGPMPQVFRIISNMKIAYEVGARGFFIENENYHCRDFWALDQWVLHRLMEDPTLDGDTLIDTFIRDYYGKAGKFVKEYLMLAHRIAEESSFVIMLDEPITNWGFANEEFVQKGLEILLKALASAEGDKTLERRIKVLLSGVYITIATRYYDFERSNPACLTIDRDAAFDAAIDCINAYYEIFGCDIEGKEINSYLPKKNRQYIDALNSLKESTKRDYPLPEELAGIDKKNIVDVYGKDIVRFFEEGRGNSIVEDEDAVLDKVLKLSLNEMTEGYRARYVVTEEDALNPKPLSFFVREKHMIEDVYVNKTDVYKKDISTDGYKLYKLGGIRGITPTSNLMFYIIHNRDLAVNISEICRFMPFEECDIYVSMKATGEHYGGKAEDEDALYFERVIVVKTK